MSAEGGGIPEPFHIFHPITVPAIPGSPEVHSIALTYSFVALGIVLLVALIARLTLKVIPSRSQNLVEWLFDTVMEQGRGIFGEHAMRYMPLFIFIFLFILTCNLMGLVPGFMSPTASYHTNFAMALTVAIVTQWAGIRVLGLKGYLGHFLPPPCPLPIKILLMSWLWPMIHLLEQVVRPISLTMRLFGNIYAKEMLLLMLAFIAATFIGSPQNFVRALSVMPLALRPAIVILGTLVSLVQAAVFTILSMAYVASAIEHSEEEGHEGHA